MIPIRDDNPTRRVTWMTWLVMAANIGVFAYMATLDHDGLFAFVHQWGFTPASFTADPLAPATLVTVLSSMFMHGGWLHLGGNMLYLWIFGNNIEDKLGPLGFLLFYVVTGALAVGAHTVTGPESTVPLVGASGAIAGVLGAYLVLYPRARVMTIIPIFFIIELAALPAAFVIGFWFLMQIAQAVGSLGPETTAGGVAWFAHVGGFVAGLVLTVPLRARDAARRARTTRAKRQER